MMNWKRYFRILLAAGILSLTTGITALAADETATETAAESAGLTAEDTDDEAEPQTSRVITLGEAAKETEAAAEETAGDPEPAAENAQEPIEEETAAEDVENGTEETGLVSLGIFRTTAYCPCYACSEGYGRHTCTGAIARANHTIAVDPRVIPYGSRVMINGTVYTAEDRGGGVKGRHIDIFYDTHAQSRQYGSRKAEVFLLT